MPKESLVASLLGGTIGFDTTTSWLQGLFYSSYLIAVLIPYLSNKESTKRVPAAA
jgi:high-affinity iron transporter